MKNETIFGNISFDKLSLTGSVFWIVSLGLFSMA